MLIVKPTDDRRRSSPSPSAGVDESRRTLEFESLAQVDMSKLSQSELYSLSRCSASAFDLESSESLTVRQISADRHSSVSSITAATAATITPTRIFAFSHRRSPGYRSGVFLSQSDGAENRSILNSLAKLVTEGECSKRERKKKGKVVEEEELQGLGVINVTGEDIDLKFLACGADEAFESQLLTMTEGMGTESEFLGFMGGLQGQWGSTRKRRKLVDAAYFVKALPMNWMILLSLRPRAAQPSLYCRRFLSPSGIHFKSCKDVAFYLKAQFISSAGNHPKEGGLMQIDSGCQAGLLSQVDKVPSFQNNDADPQLAENKSISNSLQKLFVDGEVQDNNPDREVIAVDNEGEYPRRKRKRKVKVVEQSGEEFEGQGIINVTGEEIDLKFLACGADGAYEAILKEMTEEMTGKDELLEFLRGLEGQWGSSRKRRKLVDAAFFMKALPANWKILLSLRPRHSRPSLYCRRYVSPSGMHFKSCKDAALYLKAQFVEDVADSPGEGAMVPAVNGCQVDLASQVDNVPSSQNADADPQLPETKSTSNSFQNLFVNGEVQYSNPCREMVVVGNEDGFRRRKRKRKAKMLVETGQELDGLDAVYVCGEVVDLKFLMHGADGLFEEKLRELTKGLALESELLDFLRGLEGQWGSSRKRRKLVDAALFMKALPANWKILLSLRPRHQHPSLYCRRYVSPTGIDFKSCKDAALYLKAQFIQDVADSPGEGAMILAENGGQVDLACQVDDVPSSQNTDADPQLPETKSTSNSFQNLFVNGEVQDCNRCREMVVVGNENGFSRRKRKRKAKMVEEMGQELDGLDTVNIQGEVVDLKFLMRGADGLFEAKLRKMTEGKATENELLDFLRGLEGQWGSSRKRRKLVDAAFFVKALPMNWKILLSLRPRHWRPSLYCRRYVSPSGIHFKSCKDVAFHLKAQFVENVADPPDEEPMMLIESGCEVEIISQGDEVPRSSVRGAAVGSAGIANLCNVPIYSLIECYICRMPFTSIGGLEQHLGKFHGTTTRRLDFNTLTGRTGRPLTVVNIRSPTGVPSATHKMDAPLQITEKSLKQNLGALEKEVDPLQDTVMEFKEPRVNEAVTPKDGFLNGHTSLILPEQSHEPKSNSEVFKRLSEVNINKAKKPKVSTLNVQASSIVPVQSNDPKSKSEVLERVPLTDRKEAEKPKDISLNGQTSWSLSEKSSEPEHNSKLLKKVPITNTKSTKMCIWCLKEFIFRPDGANTPVGLPPSICPGCQLDIARDIERARQKERGTVNVEGAKRHPESSSSDEIVVPPQITENPPQQTSGALEETGPFQDTVITRDDTRSNDVQKQAASADEPKSDLVEVEGAPRNFKTKCMWCRQYFFREPVDAETMADSTGFMCSTCKEVTSGSLESTLSRMYSRADQ